MIDEAWECNFCDGATVEQLIYEEGMGPRPPVKVRQTWPLKQPRDLDQSVPAAIRSLFLEGSVCEAAGAMRGAAAMYRGTVEELCKDRGAAGRTLYDRIESLKAGGLDPEVVQSLHEARMLGNDSIHDGLIYASNEVADVANLIEEAAIILYVQPAQRAALRAARQARRSP
ncbi:DUF4145 domain-containing protein [Acrocarpospora pleiomorpha]|uniref:DUF4145 domain-containing protein n=1 Tax=Acrocarpospora pleiomorpha TaxID=90975 RepID=UPI0031E22C78